ncbi:MAG: formimidoylglutamate deiminase [Dermatophilaceae bacterium]
MTSYWADHAWLPSGPARGVRLVVGDGRFVSVETRTTRRGDDVHLHGVVLPGLANVHSHIFQRALRGRTQIDADNALAWQARMLAVAERITPDLYLALARATFAEMALAGYTVVGEFHYLHHGPGGVRYEDPNAMGHALAQAAAEAGVRLTLVDVCYLSGGLTAEGHLPTTGVLERFSDGSVEAWAERMRRVSQSPMLRRGAAVHSVRRVPRDQIRQVAGIVGESPLHVYVSERPSENLACQMYYGCSPTRLLADSGALGPETTAIHATHLSDDDLDLLAQTRTQAGLCPTSEADLADGLPDVRGLVDRGVAVSLGSDQHAVLDPFLEMREVEMHERLASGERGRVSTADLVQMATVNGYRSLGWYDGGQLAPGMLADFVVVDMETTRTVGAKPAQIAYAATAADVVTVVVGGRTVVEDGHHVFGPVAPLLRESMGLIGALP